MNHADPPEAADPKGSAVEVFWVFLMLGLTSFGGPAAHLARFRDELAVRRHWLTESEFASLLALCHFLPGPSSSQAGMALGLHRAGPAGMLSAWLAFTAPSAIAMTLFALSLQSFGGLAESGLIHGLKIAALVIVAHAVLGMGKSFWSDARGLAVGLLAAFACLTLPSGTGQFAALGLGLGAGLLWIAQPDKDSHANRADMAAPHKSYASHHISQRVALVSLCLFVLLLGLALTLPPFIQQDWIALGLGLIESGSLVFGGGHVVLPLLEAQTSSSGLLGQDTFMAGYGAAQVVPGPLFSFAAYVGASINPPFSPWLMAGISTLCIFLPGALILIGAMPYWSKLQSLKSARGLIAGLNASVTGLLLAALIDPIGISALLSLLDLAIGAAAFAALTLLRVPPLLVIAGCAIAGAAAASLDAVALGGFSLG